MASSWSGRRGDRGLLRASFVFVRGDVTLHFGGLPASALSLLRNAHPSMLVAVAPAAALADARVTSGSLASVGGRTAQVVAAETLGIDAGTVALLSPALVATCAPVNESAAKRASGKGRIQFSARVRIEKALPAFPGDSESPRLGRVTLAAYLPYPAPDAENPAQIARTAKKALLGRGARKGDVVAISRSTWLSVLDVAVTGETESGHDPLVDIDTEIGLAVGKSRASGCISTSMREWVRAQWPKEDSGWSGGDIVAEIEGFLTARSERTLSRAGLSRVCIIALTGLYSDARDAVEDLRVGRAFFEVDARSDDSKKFIETIARAELACNSGDNAVDSLLFIHHADHLEEELGHLLCREARSDGMDGSWEATNHIDALSVSLSQCADRTAVFVVSCENMEDLDPALRGSVVYEVDIPRAAEIERRELLLPADSKELLQMTVGLSRREVLGMRRMYLEFGGLESASDALQRFGKGKLAVNAGNVQWADVGGLDDAKREISHLVRMSQTTDVDNVDFAFESTRRVGVLLYGPPGTGKTLVAKAVAGECDCSFISVKGPELLDMYVGESERNVRNVFSRAEDASPCVVFFDEIDALAPARGRGGSDAGGVADRVVSQLLAELDGAAARRGVFIIAATNRPDLVDPSVLRPGRFDKLVYVPTPESRAAQQIVLEALTRKFDISADVDFSQVLSIAPDPPLLSGADLYSLASEAWLLAARRKVEQLGEVDSNSKHSGKYAGSKVHDHSEDIISKAQAAEEEEERILETNFGDLHSFESKSGLKEREPLSPKNVVTVSQLDFLEACSKLKPSLTLRELEAYRSLRQKET